MSSAEDMSAVCHKFREKVDNFGEITSLLSGFQAGQSLTESSERTMPTHLSTCYALQRNNTITQVLVSEKPTRRNEENT